MHGALTSSVHIPGIRQGSEGVSQAVSELVTRPREDFLWWLASSLQMPSQSLIEPTGRANYMKC